MLKTTFQFAVVLVISGLILFTVSTRAFGQQTVKGIVLEESAKGSFTPIIGASIYWLGTDIGTATDTSGFFSIPVIASDSSARPKLIVRYLGYENDTLEDFSLSKLRVVLASAEGKRLKEVTVEGRIPPSFQSMETINTNIMTGKELMKAACCNLSESFENNPTVEVNYGDAVTGAKQIQMLGLSGNYTQITQENLPGIRGLMTGFGLGFTPGPWVESIQVTKGVGSVANGYESMTGQINVELKKPDWAPKTREKLFVNIYGNSMGRLESNINATQKLTKKWFVTHLIHGNMLQNEVDHNHDGYLDLPTGFQLNGIQRWRYDDGKGVTAQFGFQAMKDERTGGQANTSHSGTQIRNPYVINLLNRQLNAFGKLGYIFPQKKYKSIGFMSSMTDNKTDHVFGITQYTGSQQTLYANLIYQSIIGTTNLKFRLGGSFRRDQYNEQLYRVSSQGTSFTFKRTEVVPGVFGEFTWNPKPRFTAVAGLRVDHHNIFGNWITPRLHLKYDLTEKSIIRLSGGNGRRIANILAENTSVFASSRDVIFPIANEESALYSSNSSFGNQVGGLRPEQSWNYGLSWNHSFSLIERNGNFTFDAYRTDFINQVVVDLDQASNQVLFYNLDGKSFSNALQFQIDYEVIKRLDLRVAYKWLDVRQTYHNQVLERPFVSRNRFFINLAYASRSKWKIDATLNWNGSKRIPGTQNNPEGLKFRDRSPSYFTVNAQVSKTVSKNLDLYVGGENLTNFRQNQLINNPGNPFGSYFDASLVWGPVFGRMIYGGLRLTIR